jgi:hypothetical protein
VARLKAKKKSSAAKKSRRKHREAAEGREQGEEGEDGDEDAVIPEVTGVDQGRPVRPKKTVKIQEIRI